MAHMFLQHESFSHTFSDRGEDHNIKLTITPRDRDIDPVVLQAVLRTAVEPASISHELVNPEVFVNGLQYKFTANTNGTGLPSKDLNPVTNPRNIDSVHYIWKVDGADVPNNTKSTFFYTFAQANHNYNVSLETIFYHESVGTKQETITTPMLPANIDHRVVSGLSYELTANTTDTGLPASGVDYEWTVDGQYQNWFAFTIPISKG